MSPPRPPSCRRGHAPGVWLGKEIGWTWPRCDAACQPLSSTLLAKSDVMDEDFSDVSLADMVAEVKRELALRSHAYPKQVQTRRYTQADADRFTRRLRAVLKLLMVAERDLASHV